MLYADIDEQDPTKIVIPKFEWRFKEQLHALPSSKYKSEKWFFNLSWQMCLALRFTFKDNLEIGPNLKAWADKEYNEVILPAFSLRNAPDAEGYPRLFPHQRADVKFLSTAKRAILANGMGSGKSQSAFSTVRYLHEQGKNVFPVLIVAPNSTKGSWKREVEQVWPGLTVAVIDGTATKRRKIFSEQAHVYIINWESLRSHSRLAPFGSVALKKCVDHGGLDASVKPTACEAHSKELNEIDFNTVIGDEIHRIKDPSSKVSRAFKAASGDAEYRFAMSGTPIASSPEDLFSVLNWLYPHAYPSKSKFLDRFCQTHFNSFGARIVIGIKPEMEQEFFAGLDPFLRRMPKEAILPFLPPILRERRDVEMGAKQKKAYDQMKEQMIAELDSSVVHTTSPLTKMMRCLQFASAYAEVETIDSYNKKKKEVEKKLVVKLSDPSSKLDAFMDDIDDFGKESVIVFAQSKQLINLLSARMTKAKIPHGMITGDQDPKERDVHMANFQEGSTQFILCTIGAGGTGITLTKGSIMVFLQRDWSMIGNLQAEARGHRIGSEIHEKVQIIDYVTAGTVEEEVFKAIEAKSNNLEFILRDTELMRKVLENRLEESDLPNEQFDLDKAMEQLVEEYEEEYV
jgi:SNF2 family DNA or RNA helicase